MSILLYVVALVGGAATNVAVGMNTTLSKALADHRILAALATQDVGFVVLLLIALAGGAFPSRLSLGTLAGVPWWAWDGGAVQALAIFSVLLAAGASGAALFSALTVMGGTVKAVAPDHLGLLGFAQRDATPGRLSGCTLPVAGPVLVARG